jgi:hypothetical protein
MVFTKCYEGKHKKCPGVLAMANDAKCTCECHWRAALKRGETATFVDAVLSTGEPIAEPTATAYDYSIAGIREHYRKNRPDGHWFDADTLRFWGSRFGHTTFTTPNDGTRVYFVSSEYDGPGQEARLYSIRCYDYTTAEVSTIASRQYATEEAALAGAQFVAGAAEAAR